jgi:hypothetical protein
MDGAPLEHIDVEETWLEEPWGEQPFGAPMPRAFRLSDAERIAAHRLEGAAEGSLKEALATVIVDFPGVPGSLGERLEKIAPVIPDAAPVSEMPGPPARVLAAASAAEFGWFGAVPPAHAVPCFEEREPDMDLVAAFAPPPVVVSAPMPAPAQEIVEAAAQSIEEPVVLAQPDVFESPPPAVEEPPPVAPLPMEAPAPMLALPEDPNLEPIVTAYAASARLAADAAAASQALFELQRLLNQQMLEASPELSVAMEAHGLAGLDAIPVAQQPEPAPEAGEQPLRAPDPATDANLVPPRLIQQAPPSVAPRVTAAPPPLPLPLAVKPAATVPEMPKVVEPSVPSRPADAPVHQLRGRPEALRHATPDSPPRTASSRAPAVQTKSDRTERRRTTASRPSRPVRRASTFDVRGFAAGFVLSGAIGVVLYFVMATT